REKGVIAFEVAESLKGAKSPIASFRHVIRAGAEGSKPILDWAEEGKTAVMFSIESKPGNPGRAVGIGYVFLDESCYSVDYNSESKCWLLIRAEPGMSACYHGSVARLREAVRDILDGKKVKAPTKESAKEDGDKRRNEVNDELKKIR